MYIYYLYENYNKYIHAKILQNQSLNYIFKNVHKNL